MLTIDEYLAKYIAPVAKQLIEDVKAGKALTPDQELFLTEFLWRLRRKCLMANEEQIMKGFRQELVRAFPEFSSVPPSTPTPDAQKGV